MRTSCQECVVSQRVLPAGCVVLFQGAPDALVRQKSTAADSCMVRGADWETVPYEATPAQ